MARIKAANMKEWLTPIGIIAVIALLTLFIWGGLRDLRDDVHSVEVRLAVLETDVAHLKQDVAEVKDDVKAIRDDLKEIRDVLQSGQSGRAALPKASPASYVEHGQ